MMMIYEGCSGAWVFGSGDGIYIVRCDRSPMLGDRGSFV
jgi:hypothetical protein